MSGTLPASNGAVGSALLGGARRASLVIEDLKVAYDRAGERLEVLAGVSLEVARGEVYGLVGESGCGKSTLAYALARYLPSNGRVEGGSVTLDGDDVLGLHGDELRRWRASKVAMVYQEPGSALNPTMRIGDQVAEVFTIQGIGRDEALDRARKMLGTVALPTPGAIMKRYPHQLSGGQQQRVVISMALAVRPRLLILDEPTTGLDATVEAEVLDLVVALRSELDAAVLFITHNLALVKRMCDRLGVLYAGRLVEQGAARSVLVDPQHPYTVGLLSCVPRLGRTKGTTVLEPIPGSLPPLGTVFDGCTYADRCPIAVPPCRDTEPVLAEVAPGRLARCIRPGEAPVITPVEAPARQPSEPGLLEVVGLTKRYGDITACDDVTLEIGHGEVVGLVGESGSGKTTLGRCIVGLTAPDDGSISFEGEAQAATVSKRGPAIKRLVQMVFQSPESTLNPRHTLGAILRRSVKQLGGKRTVDELAGRVNLDRALLGVTAGRLSGGQKQRAAIARAFAGEPSLVVCDEPVSALDVSVQAAVLKLLAELQESARVSYLFISHDLAVVRYLADRIAVMYLGQLVEVGSAEEVFVPPHHPYTEALLSAIPSLDDDDGGARRRTALRGETPTLVDLPQACRFFARCPHRIEGLCDVEMPQLQTIGPGHQIRCHRPADELVELQRRMPEPDAVPLPTP